MRPISAIKWSVVLGLVCGGITGCVDTEVYDFGCQVGLFDCAVSDYGCQAGDCAAYESQCCDLTGDNVDGICIELDPEAPPSLSGYCASACHITDDCVDGAICLHPSPCDGDPLTKGVCTLVEDADPALVECPDERP